MKKRTKLVLTSAVLVILCLVLGIKVHRLQSEGWELSFPGSHGKEIAELEGVKVFTHNSSRRGTYGMEFQCVEFVNRFYATKLNYRNMSKTGDADTYFWNARAKGLESYLNGGNVPPQKYDILVFDNGPEDGQYGHVGIVSKVDLAKGEVEMFQQNARMIRDAGLFQRFEPVAKLRIVQPKRGGWFIQSGKASNYPVIGWSRKPAN